MITSGIFKGTERFAKHLLHASERRMHNATRNHLIEDRPELRRQVRTNACHCKVFAIRHKTDADLPFAFPVFTKLSMASSTQFFRCSIRQPVSLCMLPTVFLMLHNGRFRQNGKLAEIAHSTRSAWCRGLVKRFTGLCIRGGSLATSRFHHIVRNSGRGRLRTFV